MADDNKPSPTADDRPPAQHPDQQAGQDETIAKRLAKNPGNPDAKLDVALDESMDASDPPAQSCPGNSGEPAPSSGYDEAAEEALRRNK